MGSSPSNPAPTPQPPYQLPTPAPTLPSACGIRDDSKPQLAVEILDLDDAGTGSDVYASVLFGSSERRAEWSDWKLLYHDGCNNLNLGDTDYFDEFNDATREWYAVALYNCGDDNVAIKGIEYWDGSGPEVIQNWCADIVSFADIDNCMYQQVHDAGECYNNRANSPIYEAVWLDSNACQAIAFDTTHQSTDGTKVASLYFKSTPGEPTCTASKSTNFFVNFGDMMTAQNMDYNIIGILAGILLLFGLIFTFLKRKKATKEYQQLLH